MNEIRSKANETTKTTANIDSIKEVIKVVIDGESITMKNRKWSSW